MTTVLNDVLTEFDELSLDHQKLDEANEEYLKKVQELTDLQELCKKHITHQKYRLKIINKTLKDIPESDVVKRLKENISQREAQLQDIEQTLPKKTDRYLVKLIIGNIDVSFLSKNNKFKYKEEYETFKVISHFVAFFVAIVLYFFKFRPLEKLLIGFLIWYYCVIAIREAILKVNGSRIKGWWRVHHLLSIASSGCLIVWPDNESWAIFRPYFIYYTIYSAFIQYLQFRYQQGTLYRLKALGEMQNMDITVEGFHSWMWRGLTFLLPFLFIAYVFQLTNAVILFNLSYHHDAPPEAFILSIIFVVFVLGNTITTILVIPKKTKKNMLTKYKILSKRFYGALSDTVNYRSDSVVENNKEK